MTFVWDEEAWDDYLWWQAQDPKIVKRINALLHDIERNGNRGIGKPEPLTHEFHGYWSRRIIDEHRLPYRIDGDDVLIASVVITTRADTKRLESRSRDSAT